MTVRWVVMQGCVGSVVVQLLVVLLVVVVLVVLGSSAYVKSVTYGGGR